MYISLSVRANQLERRELNYQLSTINKVLDDRPIVDNSSAYSPTVFFVQQHERGVQRKTEVSVLLTPSKRGKGSAGEGEKGKIGHVIYARCCYSLFFLDSSVDSSFLFDSFINLSVFVIPLALFEVEFRVLV
jgi:hypothetical protein